MAFEIHLILLVSPIVFPLAFSIVTDFQRREKVLEDLGLFKSSTMIWYFCMREWHKGNIYLFSRTVTVEYCLLRDRHFYGDPLLRNSDTSILTEKCRNHDVDR